MSLEILEFGRPGSENTGAGVLDRAFANARTVDGVTPYAEHPPASKYSTKPIVRMFPPLDDKMRVHISVLRKLEDGSMVAQGFVRAADREYYNSFDKDFVATPAGINAWIKEAAKAGRDDAVQTLKEAQMQLARR